jgi:hypothetical protein
MSPNEPPVESQLAREARERSAESRRRLVDAGEVATEARRNANAAGERQARRDAAALLKLRAKRRPTP